MSKTPDMIMAGAASETNAASDTYFGSSTVGLSLAEPRDYFALMKPRVMSLVVFTAWAGLVCALTAGQGQISLFGAIASILCIAAGAGASGALNMWYDSDIDAQMSRTRKRPLPQGKMSRDAVLTFGVFISALSVFGLWTASNWVAAGLLAFTILFYAIVYTMWLKRSTPQNIVIGGAAGAFPPMIGWAAVTGTVTVDSLILFLIIFLWTPPHFWALALYKSGDYEKVGIPMMPNVKGAAATRALILAYAVLLAAVCVAPIVTGLGGPLYAIVALMLNAGFVALAYKVFRSRAGEQAGTADEASLYDVRSGDRAARNLFAFSIVYLFVIFAALAVDNLLAGLA